jgi:hypothetical protein
MGKRAILLDVMAIPKSMICNCLRCGHQWVKNVAGRPKLCPKCRSKYWTTRPGELPIGRPPKAAKAKK